MGEQGRGPPAQHNNRALPCNVNVILQSTFRNVPLTFFSYLMNKCIVFERLIFFYWCYRVANSPRFLFDLRLGFLFFFLGSIIYVHKKKFIKKIKPLIRNIFAKKKKLIFIIVTDLVLKVVLH